MTLAVAVMAHRQRAAFVDELLPQLPDAEVVWDERGDRWHTGRRALEAFDASARFHCVVQDDALLCKDFIAGAELVAAAAGDRPVALYVGKVRPHAHYVTPAVLQALRNNSPWISGLGPLWGVAIVIPTAHIGELVKWCDQQHYIANYDRRIEAFYRERSIDCWYPIPSLVDHRPVDENPSLIPGRGDNRQAHLFLGDRSPLDIDWSRAPTPIHGLTAEASHPRDERSASMGVRRFKLVQEDGTESVQLIDESQVHIFEKARGVKSIEPVDEESYEQAAVEYEGADGEKPFVDPTDDESEELIKALRGKVQELEDENTDLREDLKESGETVVALRVEIADLEAAAEARADADADVPPSPPADIGELAEPEPDEYEDLNQPALKAKLDEREIEYPSGVGVSNDDLRQLLRDADSAAKSAAAERGDDGEDLSS